MLLQGGDCRLQSVDRRFEQRTPAAERCVGSFDDRRACVPRFFFHHTDGGFDPDNEGTDFPDLATARVEAVRYAAEVVRDRPDEVWSGDTFRIEVSDEHGMLLCTVVILGLDAPAARGVRRPRGGAR